MSYRITARDYKLGKNYNGSGDLYHQIYGNNDFPVHLRDYLLSKGVKLDEDGCFLDFEVIDLQELLEVMLEIHKDQVEDDTYWDFKPDVRYKTDTVDGLLSYWDYRLYVAIVLAMYNFFKTFEDLIERYWDDESKGIKYKVKDGKKIYISGF